MALKYCSISKDGSYKYRFGAFRFPRVIPRHIRNHIETKLIGHSGIDKRSIDNDSEGLADGGGPTSTLAAIATDNLILLFRILIFYREASHRDGFYNAVGDDLGGWPGHIVEETQSVFVEGRRLFLQRFSRTDYVLPTSVEILCSLVDEWIGFQSTAQRPTANVTASWGRLRDTWRSRARHNTRVFVICKQ
ncbi:hypothetical protein SPBR_02052 [Sporothrix brasiliensis 5110]|uniref:Uncharacterized protein n=1 Tax=Sporothrix brasiliensis 5110 TaxID=1398154 RepID=A0A0C2EZJ8_9PEZI|nr:uncharacterized protein SPBR_02052 [Sporothrix brasiliensis 5110]KIH91944.1 hypothetical protein SPBR_02052 [Sporothrix brasiliensis 5110]